MGLFPAGHRATHAACVVHCSSLRPGWYETWKACRHRETVSSVCQTDTSTFTSVCCGAPSQDATLLIHIALPCARIVQPVDTYLGLKAALKEDSATK